MDYKHIANGRDLLFHHAPSPQEPEQQQTLCRQPVHIIAAVSAILIGTVGLIFTPFSLKTHTIDEPLFPIKPVTVANAELTPTLLALLNPSPIIAALPTQTVGQIQLALATPPTSTVTSIPTSTLTSAPAPAAPQWRTITIHPRDKAAYVLARLGVDRKQSKSLLSLHKTRDYLRTLHPKSTLQVLIDRNNHRVQKLRYVINDLDTLEVVSNNNATFQEKLIHQTPETRFAYVGAVVKRTLTQSAQNAGLPRKSITQLNTIFKDNLNVARGLRPGDRFNVLYQEQRIGNKKISTGDVAAAEIITRGKTYRAVRYQDPQGKVSYYTPEGASLQTGFLRIPLRYTHISSGYSLNRFDPVMHKTHAHPAIDFAAPQGTPIQATADGQIAYQGARNGYGNTVILHHHSGYSTLYAHMHHFAKNMHAGSSVKKGQVIGYVGQTGMATGPHLHYEFRAGNGTRYNPLTVSLPPAAPLSGSTRTRFLAQAHFLLAQLHVARNVRLASNTDGKSKRHDG